MEVSFEDALFELEEIVKQLEKGDMSLDESLEFFEKGIKLVKECDEKLKNAKQKIEKLVEKNGELKFEEF